MKSGARPAALAAFSKKELSRSFVVVRAADVVVGPRVPAFPVMDTVVVTVDDAILATMVFPATVVVGTWTVAKCDVTVTTGAFTPSAFVNAVLMADVTQGAVISESDSALATGSVPVGKVTM